MNKVQKVAIPIAIRVKEGTSSSCSMELEQALKQLVGSYFLKVKVAEAGGIFNDLGLGQADLYTCYLIFQGGSISANFERESMEDILDKLQLKSFDVIAVSHSPIEFVQYE